MPGGTTSSGAPGTYGSDPQGQGAGRPPSADGGSSGGGSASQGGALEQALQTFDGEILAERAVIEERSNRTASRGAGGHNALPPAGGDGGGAATAGRAASAPAASRTPRQAPAMPGRGGGGRVAGGVPDARDDDIIARQLREAAMAEQDPALREKLWREYERYKGR